MNAIVIVCIVGIVLALLSQGWLVAVIFFLIGYLAYGKEWAS